MMEKILHRKLAHSFKHLQSKGWQGRCNIIQGVVCGVGCAICTSVCRINVVLILNPDFIVAVITDEIVEVSTVFSTEYSFQCWDGR